MDPKAARTLLLVTGAALLVGFFLPWVDLGFGPTISGFAVARHAPSGALLQMMLWLVPIGGLAMIVTAATGSRHARLTSVLVGLGLVGYAVVKTVHAFFATTGLGLWLVIAASVGALAVPLLTRPER
ncbi:MAG: hypothetical protein HYV09_18970 [Deltaproteobacteria bacterium]|nr:hypothetical protein [Deltaproteobacteria bacterium]